MCKGRLSAGDCFRFLVWTAAVTEFETEGAVRAVAWCRLHESGVRSDGMVVVAAIVGHC